MIRALAAELRIRWLYLQLSACPISDFKTFSICYNIIIAEADRLDANEDVII